MMNPAQCRAARALLDWSQMQLADASGAEVSTIRDFETGKKKPAASNVGALQRALEGAGIGFVSEIGGDGVTLRRKADQGDDEA